MVESRNPKNQHSYVSNCGGLILDRHIKNTMLKLTIFNSDCIKQLLNGTFDLNNSNQCINSVRMKRQKSPKLLEVEYLKNDLRSAI